MDENEISAYHYEVRRFQHHSNLFQVEFETPNIGAAQDKAIALLKTDGSRWIQIWRVFPNNPKASKVVEEWN